MSPVPRLKFPKFRVSMPHWLTEPVALRFPWQTQTQVSVKIGLREHPSRNLFLDRLARISRLIKERKTIHEIDPTIFGSLAPTVLNTIERRFNQMKDDALNELLEKAHHSEMEKAIAEARKKRNFDPVARAMKLIAKSGHDPLLLSYLGTSVDRYLSMAHTVDFIRRELIEHKRGSNPRALARFLSRNSRAGHHFAGLQTDYDLSEIFSQFKDELRLYHREAPRINGMHISGLNHHLAIGKKWAFLSAYPSVFGGDNFHLAELPNGKTGNRKFFVSNVDLSGHASDYLSGINKLRHFLMGYDKKAVDDKKSGDLADADSIHEFLREYGYGINNHLHENGLQATAFAAIYDEASRQLHYVVSGQTHPTFFHPQKGIFTLAEYGDTLLGAIPTPSQEEREQAKLRSKKIEEPLTVHTVTLEPGMGFWTSSDGPLEVIPAKASDEIKDQSRTRNIKDELDALFHELMRQGVPPDEIARQLMAHSYKIRGVPFLNDDGRLFVAVAH